MLVTSDTPCPCFRSARFLKPSPRAPHDEPRYWQVKFPWPLANRDYVFYRRQQPIRVGSNGRDSSGFLIMGRAAVLCWDARAWPVGRVCLDILRLTIRGNAVLHNARKSDVDVEVECYN